MSPFNTILTALRGLLGNKLRAALTTLGIIIGVASVISMLALGNGARSAVESSFRFLGSDNVRITAKRKLDQGELVPVGERLSHEDGLLMSADVELVDQVIMSVSGGARVRHGRAVLDMVSTGVTHDALELMSVQSQVQPKDWPNGRPLRGSSFIGRGRFFTPPEVLAGADICVLGHKTALDLFGSEDAVDQVVWIDRQRCTVVGVIVELETIDPSQRLRARPNETLYLPISTAILTLFDSEPSVQITARVMDESRMDEGKAQVASYLRERHGIEKDFEGWYEDDFDLTTRQDILGAQQESARTFSLLLATMAVVSLIVGGIGIMNVMLVSVTERTREIGVRMAVGARQMDVIGQFLLEAVAISAIGGLIGVAVGIFAIPVAASLNDGVALLDRESIPLAFGVAVLTASRLRLVPRGSGLSIGPDRSVETRVRTTKKHGGSIMNRDSDNRKRKP